MSRRLQQAILAAQECILAQKRIRAESSWVGCKILQDEEGEIRVFKEDAWDPPNETPLLCWKSPPPGVILGTVDVEGRVFLTEAAQRLPPLDSYALIQCMTLATRLAARWLSKRADLMPPLGYPGGTCHVVRRIRDELPDGRLEDTLVSLVENGEDLPNAAANKVYDHERERGPWKFNLFLTPHAQYRMDLRGITVPQIRASLDLFFRTLNKERSRGRSPRWEAFQAGAKTVWEDPRLGVVVVFQRTQEHIITVITTYSSDGESASPARCPF